ncbi:MAG: response regulator [Betaproteobacteria bacterium]|nr:response regulator [Betaproteobacteria bacterium]
MTSGRPVVLVIEDEPPIRKFLRASLEAQGFSVEEAESGERGLAMAANRRPEAIVLDLGLPDVDGVEVIVRLREWSRVPIVVLSARTQEGDKIRALDAGADDYVVKPFGVGELLARLRVAMRHAAIVDGTSAATSIEAGNLKIDLTARRVMVSGKEVHLTPTEYRLLAELAKHSGKVLTQRHLLKEVWGPGYADRPHYLRIYMANLRAKLEADPARPQRLQTETGVGYRLSLDAN